MPAPKNNHDDAASDVHEFRHPVLGVHQRVDPLDTGYRRLGSMTDRLLANLRKTIEQLPDQLLAPSRRVQSLGNCSDIPPHIP